MYSKLLVVEDVPIARKILQIILTELGYQFDMAGNGLEAIRLFKRKSL
jgi:CheY-like chemotaxis protein